MFDQVETPTGAMEVCVVYKSFRFKAKTTWNAARRGVLSAAGKPNIVVGSPPEFKGEPDNWAPEELLVGSVNTCILLTFLTLAQARGLIPAGYENDWLAPSIDWDVSRDQLARNVEAVWSLARAAGKDYYLLLCHEGELKHHMKSNCWMAIVTVHGLLAGLTSPRTNVASSLRIGTITWSKIADTWPELRKLPELQDLPPAHSEPKMPVDTCACGC
jgi:hypothetical protein